MAQYYLLNPYDIPAKYSQRPMLEQQNNFFPLVGAIVGYVAPTLVAGTASYFLASAAVYIGLTALTSWAINSLVPKQKGKEGMLVNKKDPVAYQEIVYGRVRKGGVITFMNTTGSKNRTLDMVLVLAGHEVNSIGQIYINDEAVTLDSNGYVTSHGWKSKIRIWKYTGTESQTSPLHTSYPNYASFRGKGIAYLFCVLTWDDDVFSNGIPTITAVVEGKKVTNTGMTASSFSQNPARIIQDYLLSDYGLKASTSEINSSSFATAANACDDVIPKTSGNTARYRTNGVLSMGDTHKENLQKLLDACGGTLFWSNGQWHLKVAKYSTPSVTFTTDDLRDGLIVNTKNSRKDNFNRVVGTFSNEENRYLTESYPDVVSTVFTTLDGEESTYELNFDMVTDPAIVQRLAKIALYRSREEIVVESSFSLKAMECQPGDTVNMTIPRYGWENKPFEVVNWGLDYNGEVKVRMTLKETSPEAYQWDADEKAILHNNTNLPSPRGGLSISDITLTQTHQIQEDGTVRTLVTASWPEPENGFVSHYNFYYTGETAAKTQTTATETSVTVGPLKQNVTYTFGVRAVSVSGSVGDWYTKTLLVNGDITPPANPTSITAVGGFQQNTIKWTNPTAPDFSHNEIWMAATSGGTKTLLAKVTGTTYIHSDLSTSQTVWYFLKAVDRTGNVNSSFTSGVSATTKKILSADLDPSAVDTTIADGSITIAKFASSIRPIEIVTSLPTTGNYNGRQAFLTTDGKLYRYTSGSWTSEVDGADLKANSVVAGKIQAGAVGVDQLAANAVRASKVAISDNTNLYLDSELLDENYWRFTSGASISTTSLTGETSVRKFLLPANNGTSVYVRNNNTIPVKPGETYMLVGDIRDSGNSPRKFTCALTFWWYDKDGNYLSTNSKSTVYTSASVITDSYSRQVPDNAYYMTAGFNRPSSTTDDNGGGYIMNPRLYKRYTGELLVDGTITSIHLASNSVTSDKILAGSITADKIATGEIITDSMIVNGATARQKVIDIGGTTIPSSGSVSPSGTFASGSFSSSSTDMVMEVQLPVFGVSGHGATTLRVLMQVRESPPGGSATWTTVQERFVSFPAMPSGVLLRDTRHLVADVTLSDPSNITGARITASVFSGSQPVDIGAGARILLRQRIK